MQLCYDQQSRSSDKKRERLEELYILVGHWLNELDGHSLSCSMVMKGKLDYSQHVDLIIEKDSNKKNDFNRLEMILSIYADELKLDYDYLIESRAKSNKIWLSYRKFCEKDGLDGGKFLDPYVTASLERERLGKDFKKKIAVYANGI